LKAPAPLNCFFVFAGLFVSFIHPCDVASNDVALRKLDFTQNLPTHPSS